MPRGAATAPVDVTRRVFITGGASGLGRSLVALCLARRDSVWTADIREAPSEGAIRHSVCDVGSPEDVARVRSEMDRAGFLPDLAILNAGINAEDPDSGEVGPVFERLFRTNVQGIVAWVHHLLPAFLDRGTGHFVAISSLSALASVPHGAAYAASKAAVTRLFEGYRLTYGERGVRFTTIQPGMIDTAMSRHVRKGLLPVLPPEEAARRVLAAVESGRRTASFPLTSSLATRLLAALPPFAYDRAVRLVYRLTH